MLGSLQSGVRVGCGFSPLQNLGRKGPVLKQQLRGTSLTVRAAAGVAVPHGEARGKLYAAPRHSPAGFFLFTLNWF